MLRPTLIAAALTCLLVAAAQQVEAQPPRAALGAAGAVSEVGSAHYCFRGEDRSSAPRFRRAPGGLRTRRGARVCPRGPWHRDVRHLLATGCHNDVIPSEGTEDECAVGFRVNRACDGGSHASAHRICGDQYDVGRVGAPFQRRLIRPVTVAAKVWTLYEGTGIGAGLEFDWSRPSRRRPGNYRLNRPLSDPCGNRVFRGQTIRHQGRIGFDLSDGP